MNSSIVSAVRDAVNDSDCVVALGGGADSAVLLWAACEVLGPERIEAVFVFHDLEGSEMLRDSAGALAAQLRVRLMVIDRPISDGGNLEARARTERYDAMEALLVDGRLGLTGHTADDQAETIVMRMFRGSGSGGLSGIPSARGAWRRPLLDMSRSTLRETAIELHLPFSDDPANEDKRFVRSRVRHIIMPTIERELGPESKSNVARSGALLGADDALLQRQANLVPTVRFPGGVSIPIGAIVSAPRPVASRVVRNALHLLMKDAKSSQNDVDAVLKVANGSKGITISNGFIVTPERPFVTIHATSHSTNQLTETHRGQEEIEIEVGSTFEWFGNEYTVTRHPISGRYRTGGRFTVLSSEAVQPPTSARNLGNGDRIDTGHGSTPLTELLRRTGVPARVRRTSLVVTVSGKVAALGGIRVASWAAPRHGQPAVVIKREYTQ